MKSSIQVYKVRWWGCLGSAMGRPDYRILDIHNGIYRVRFCIVAGRPLGNYVLPYWPIRSFLSIISPPTELAHQARVLFNEGGEARDVVLRTGDAVQSHHLSDDNQPWARFQVARTKRWTVLKVTNEGSASPLRMEHYVSIPEGEPCRGVYATSGSKG